MGNTNTPYIAKAAAPLVNPTVQTVFTAAISPIATVASTQVAKSAFIYYRGFSQYGSGVSDNINLVNIVIRAAGRVTGGGTTNFTPSIQFATGIPSTTAASNTTIASLTAAAFNTASGNWKMSVELLWDPTSGQINGSFSGYAGSGGTQTFTALTAITPLTGQVAPPAPTVLSNTVATAIPAATGELALYFAAAGLFSASFAGNVTTLDSFECEVL